MDNDSAFRPAGQCVPIDAPTSSPPTGILLGATTQTGEMSVMVFNGGTNLGWLAYGPSAAQAQANAVAPTGTTAETVLPIPPGTIQTFTFNWQTYFSALAVTGSTYIYLIPGEGV